MTDLQQTIARPVKLSGQGLFSGKPVNMVFYPAEQDTGIIFQRVDLGDNAQVAALVTQVVKQDRRTALRNGDAIVETCEHCLSALAGLGIDNVRIEIDAAELPGADGSAKPFMDVLLEAGIVAGDKPRHRLKVDKPVMVRDGDAMVAALPCDEPGMQVLYELEYARSSIGRQVFAFDLGDDDYQKQIAPARTFLLDKEAKQLHAAGIGTHLSAKEVLVIGDSGPLEDNHYRFDDEPVRHKIVDLIGDLYLLGAPIQGRIVAHKSGHELNHRLVRELIKHHRGAGHTAMALNPAVADIRTLLRILPHRYPMLLVDRVLQLDGPHRIVGIKNVTINEPFFQGHYPGTPIMPGVLIVEAMAQLSGLLIVPTLEHTGKLAVLLSLDRVKLRRPVTPGDQLVLEATSVRARSRIAHTRCKAYVGDEIAAEAEVKFMLVDDEQE